MKRQIITTRDGSHTVEIPEMQVTYHSHHGAVQESMHVFIEAGLHGWLDQNAAQSPVGATGGAAAETPIVRVFEMGFGTGLNAYLTALDVQSRHLPVHYTAVEKYPLAFEEAEGLNYGAANKALFHSLHQCPWNTDVPVTPIFSLYKHEGSLQDFASGQPFHIIYFDAFAPTAQPELWTEAIFSKLFGMLHPGGLLVTYCSKGVVRRAMQAAGFTVTKIPGPAGKREMVRAVRSL